MGLTLTQRAEKLAAQLHPEDKLAQAAILEVIASESPRRYVDAVVADDRGPTLSELCSIDVPEFVDIKAFEAWINARPEKLKSAERVLIVASMNATRAMLDDVVRKIDTGVLYLTISNRGVDQELPMALKAAGHAVVSFPPAWTKDNKGAPYRRNERVLKAMPEHAIVIGKLGGEKPLRELTEAMYHAYCDVVVWDAELPQLFRKPRPAAEEAEAQDVAEAAEAPVAEEAAPVEHSPNALHPEEASA